MYALAWSLDGLCIASGSSDQTVQVWNASDGQLLHTHWGHADMVYALAWSPDGTRIASGSGDPFGGSIDQTVQVWDASSGQLLLHL